MITIGLTGGIACGKSTVAHLFREMFGIPIIDADQVSRAVVNIGSDALLEIREEFGPGVLKANGALNRDKLRSIVFEDAEARARLEAITHPAIRSHIAKQLATWAQEGQPAAIVEAALLIETGGHRLYDELVIVGCPDEQQLHRLKARDKLSTQQAQAIIDTQMPTSKKLQYATTVVWNDQDTTALSDKVRGAWSELSGRHSTLSEP